MGKLRNIFCLAIILLSIPLQGREVVERLYVTTDKNSYVAGDVVGCALYCFELGNSSLLLSGFSSVAYLELVSADGVAMQEKVALVDGVGGAMLRLSPNLPSGNYKLVAYTKQNKNESGFTPYAKDITIYNTLVDTKVKGNVEIAEGAVPQGAGAENPISPLVQVSVSNGKVQGKIPVEILSKVKEKAFLSVSVYHKDSLSQLPAQEIRSFMIGALKGGAGVVSHTYVPDFEGEVVQFKSDGINRKMILSFPGRDNNIYISNVNGDGDLYFYTGSVYGTKDGMLQVMPGYTDRKHKSELVSPFIGKFDFDYPKMYITKGMKGELEAKSVAMQVSRRFGADTLTVPLPQRGDPFMEVPDKSYLLDDYTRFHTIHEVITEYISNVRIRTLDGKKSFTILYKDAVGNEMYSRFATLALLDGMPIFNHEDILGYDPMLVKQIRVYTSPYRISDITYEGVICFDTYKGNIPSFPVDKDAYMFTYKGSLYPEYLSGEQFYNNSDIPNYRETLYWNPMVRMAPGDALRFECVAPKYPGHFELVVEGVTESGQPVFYRTSFEVL